MHHLYMLHVLNHILTTRSRIQRHNKQIKEREEREDDDDDEKEEKEQNDAEDVYVDRFRDQGYTRPTVLILLPTRGMAYQFVNDMVKLLGTSVPKEQMQRFEDSKPLHAKISGHN